MGKISLVEPGVETRVVPLASSTLIGRHPSCLGRMHSEAVPLYWLEVRWLDGVWGWRALADLDRTRGPGRRVPGLGEEWRSFGVGSRVVLGAVAVELADYTPPNGFAVDMNSGEVIEGEAFDELLDERSDGAWLVGVGPEQQPAPLSDGQVAALGGRVWRFHLPVVVDPTLRGGVDAADPSARLSVDELPEGWKLTLEADGSSVEVQGAAVRAVVPYVEALIEGVPAGGWLLQEEVYQRWIELGGDPSSGPDRVTQDRSRICRTLGRSGVANAHALFQTRNDRRQWVTRLTLQGGQVALTLL